MLCIFFDIVNPKLNEATLNKHDLDAPLAAATFDPSKTTPIVCKSCNNHTFEAGFFLRQVSAIMSQNGKDSILPIPCFLCVSCGNPAGETVPQFIRKEQVAAQLPTPDVPTITSGQLHLFGDTK